MPARKGPVARSSLKFATALAALSLCALGAPSTALAQRGGVHTPQKKKPDPAPLPAYTPGPLAPMPLDQVPAVAPKVSFEKGQLTIQAHNSTLADVLKEIRKQIGADFDVPSSANERVVADIGPGPARDVLTELLNGTHFNYVIVGSLTDPTAVRNVLLTPKTAGAETASAAPPAGVPQRGIRGPIAQTPPPEAEEETPNDADDDPNPPDRDAQDAQATQPDQNQAPQTPKTPEQLLQELQQRQQQMTQQQQPGQQPPNGQPQPGLFPNQPPTAENPSPHKPE